MIGTPFVLKLIVFVLSLTVLRTGTTEELQAQAPGTTAHEHLTEVACVDVPPTETRPEFGCFNIGTARELKFGQAAVYWHLYAFGRREAAEAASSATGIVVEEDGRAWLSEFGARDIASRGGDAVAVVGPLQLAEANSYSAVLSYAVMRPGPEGWYVIAGEQRLETPAGANWAGAGQTMTETPNVPMELNVPGNVRIGTRRGCRPQTLAAIRWTIKGIFEAIDPSTRA